MRRRPGVPLIDRLGIGARRDFLERVDQGGLLVDHAPQPLRDIRIDGLPSYRLLIQIDIEPRQHDLVAADAFPIVDSLVRGHFRESGPHPVIAQNRIEGLGIALKRGGDFFDPGLHLRVGAEFAVADQTVGESLHPSCQRGQLAQQTASLGQRLAYLFKQFHQLFADLPAQII